MINIISSLFFHNEIKFHFSSSIQKLKSNDLIQSFLDPNDPNYSTNKFFSLEDGLIYLLLFI